MASPTLVPVEFVNQIGREVRSLPSSPYSDRISCSPSTDGNIASQMLTIKMLMSGKEVGSIIGKRGENVKRYREESGARINISDGSCPERIVTVTGTVDQIHVAFVMMCQKFENDFIQSICNSDDGIGCPPVTLRLLVPATQCGSVIGKGGCKIKEIRELTGASIQVASEVLPNSSERTVTISGNARAIAKCIRNLCQILLDSPPKGATIPYRPKPPFLPSVTTSMGMPISGAPLYSNCPFPNGPFSASLHAAALQAGNSTGFNAFSPGIPSALPACLGSVLPNNPHENMPGLLTDLHGVLNGSLNLSAEVNPFWQVVLYPGGPVWQ